MRTFGKLFSTKMFFKSGVKTLAFKPPKECPAISTRMFSYSPLFAKRFLNLSIISLYSSEFLNFCTASSVFPTATKFFISVSKGSLL